MADLVIRGGTLVRPEGRLRSDLRIEGRRIVEIGPELSGTTEIDGTGLHVLPALVDAHLHFNEPGRAEWEGAATGSRALAAGGGTVFVDMPLNSTPCTVNAREVVRKRKALEASSITDFGLWGGLVPGSVNEMAGMADEGVIGFKAFMCDSGLPEFPRADPDTLERGMREAARLNLPVAVHAESEEMTSALVRQMAGSTARDFVMSRPVAAEVAAIEVALDCAQATGAKLHIVHVSSGSGVAAAVAARARGVDVSIETCPHYLYFTDGDLDRIGVAGKCAPPLRSRDEQRALWLHVLEGRVDIVASDHSPCDPSLKKNGDFRASWGGIAGVQSTLAVLMERGPGGRRLPFEQLTSLAAAAPASRFGLPSKGRIRSGDDADLVLVDTSQSHQLKPEDLLQRHRISPYVGRSFTGKVVRTIRRGETIFLNGRIVADGGGRFVRPHA